MFSKNEPWRLIPSFKGLTPIRRLTISANGLCNQWKNYYGGGGTCPPKVDKIQLSASEIVKEDFLVGQLNFFCSLVSQILKAFSIFYLLQKKDQHS